MSPGRPGGTVTVTVSLSQRDLTLVLVCDLNLAATRLGPAVRSDIMIASYNLNADTGE
jgi:hypothetical protein